MKPIPEARSNYVSTPAIELWLSAPRLLGVWLCRLYIYVSIIYYISYDYLCNQGIPDFALRNFLDGLIGYNIWGLLKRSKNQNIYQNICGGICQGRPRHSKTIMKFCWQSTWTFKMCYGLFIGGEPWTIT